MVAESGRLICDEEHVSVPRRLMDYYYSLWCAVFHGDIDGADDIAAEMWRRDMVSDGGGIDGGL